MGKKRWNSSLSRSGITYGWGALASRGRRRYSSSWPIAGSTELAIAAAPAGPGSIRSGMSLGATGIGSTIRTWVDTGQRLAVLLGTIRLCLSLCQC